MSKLFSHLSSLTNSIRLIPLPVLRGLVIKRVVRIRRREERLDTEQDRADLQRRRPLCLEHVQADPSQRVDVGVVDACQETRLGGSHGVIVGEVKLQFEDATLVRRVSGTGKLYVEIAVVILIDCDLDPRC